jgi:hypothetical protein
MLRANHLVLEMERIGCWPDASTYDALLTVFLRAAEIGRASVRQAQRVLRHMTTTIHVDYPASGGYHHATAMLGSVPFPELGGPVGVARTAIDMRESHVTLLLRIATEVVAHRDGGLPDIERVVSIFGEKHLSPSCASLDAVAQGVLYAVRKGCATVRDVEGLWSKLDWFAYLAGRDGRGAGSPPQDLGAPGSLFESGKWRSLLRPSSSALAFLIEAVAVEMAALVPPHTHTHTLSSPPRDGEKVAAGREGKGGGGGKSGQEGLGEWRG